MRRSPSPLRKSLTVLALPCIPGVEPIGANTLGAERGKMDKGSSQFTKKPPPAPTTAGYWGMAVLVLAYHLSPPGNKLVASAGALFAYFFLLIVVNVIRDIVSSVKSGRPAGLEAGLLSVRVTGWILGWFACWRTRSDPSN